MKLLFRLLIALLAMVALLAILLVQMPGEDVFRLFESKVEAALGRDVGVSGEITAEMTTRPGVRASGLRVANADWGADAPMLEAAELFIGVKWASLLRGEVEITSIALSDPVIRLERSAGGATNWTLENGGTGPGGAPAIPPMVTVSGGTLSYKDAQSGAMLELRDLDLTLKQDGTGRAELDLSARLNGQPVTFTGSIAAFNAFLTGQVSPLQITAQAGGSRVDFAGRGGLEPVAAEGTLEADLADMAAAFAALGQGAPDLPEGLGRKISLTATATYSAQGNLHLRDAALGLDDNRLTGAADIILGGARPRVQAQLSAGALDFSRFSSADSTPGWSTAPLDVSALQGFDGEVALKATGVDIGLLKFGATDVVARVDAGRAVFALRQLAAYDGQLTGEFVVNARGGLSVRGNLSGTGLSSQPLLVDLAGFDRLSGPLSLTAAVLGVGNSVDAIMRSLSGSGSLQMGEGKLRGLDLVGMLSNVEGAFANRNAATNFTSITASFALQDGVLRNDDMVLTGPRVTATGAGKVDMGAQSVDYRVVPVALTAEGLSGKSVPVRVHGPWSGLKYSPDLKTIIEEDFADEKEALEEQVKKTVGEKLGVTPEAEESVEDALKRKLENEAKKGLLKLLE